jgi:hypothetical protein
MHSNDSADMFPQTVTAIDPENCSKSRNLLKKKRLTLIDSA